MDGPIPSVGDVLALVERLAPPGLAEPWDRVGLQVGNPAWPVERALVSLGVSLPVLEEAVSTGCSMVVAHHPLIFRPLVAVRTDRPGGMLIYRALEARLAVAVAHTNLDRAAGGLNDWLAEVLGLRDVVPLDEEGEGAAAMGRLGRLAGGVSLLQWVEEVASRLQVPALRYVGDPSATVRTVACVGGAGAGAMAKAVEAGADCLVTGDLKFHEALDALDAGISVVDPGHFASEVFMRDRLAAYLNDEAARRGWRFEALPATREGDPFRFFPS